MLEYFSAALAIQPEVQVNVVHSPHPFFYSSKKKQ